MTFETYLMVVAGLSAFDLGRYVFQDRNSLTYALYPKTFGWLVGEVMGNFLWAFLICLVVKIAMWVFSGGNV